MLDPPSSDPARHPVELTAAAARALRAGDHRLAFRLADRRCRIRPPASAHDHLLRAAALRGLGDRAGQVSDIREAAAIDPHDRLAARSLFRIATAAERPDSARALLLSETDPAWLRDAVAALLGPEVGTVGCLIAGPAGLRGWLAWPAGASLDLRLGCDEADRPLRIAPEPSHPLTSAGVAAAGLEWPWPDGVGTVTIRAARGRTEMPVAAFSRPVVPPAQAGRSRPARAASPSGQAGGRAPAPAAVAPAVPTMPGGDETTLTVVVPVYADLAATRACLDSLAADGSAGHARTVIVVEDATPDPELRALVEGRAASGEVVLLRNRANLGFARSVNRALERAGGDVLVLNADTVVPPGAIARLARAARSSPDIGTATPLSNNGENTSLPRRFVENPLPDLAGIVAIDAAAAAAAPGRVVDMPNGTGFCLYVTRACLRAIGGFATGFGRGYLEDVDLCLRAAEAGFRNVCAAGVYVGHAGTRSFGREKRGLVVRNLAAVEARHPGYDRACAAFFAADPLAPVRAAIDARLAGTAPPALLLLVGEGTDEAAVAGRVRAASGRHPRLLVGRAGLQAGWARLRIQDPAGGFPGDLRLAHRREHAFYGLAADLAALPLSGIDIADPDGVPAVVRAAAEALRLTVPPSPRLAPRPSSRAAGAGPPCLVLVAPPPSVASFRLLQAAIRAFAALPVRLDLVVLGETFDDLRLMASGPVHVTGPLDLAASDPAPETASFLARLGATHLASPGGCPAGHCVEAAALATGLPFAEPGTRLGLAGGKLPSPATDPHGFAARLAVWAAPGTGLADAAAA